MFLSAVLWSAGLALGWHWAAKSFEMVCGRADVCPHTAALPLPSAPERHFEGELKTFILLFAREQLPGSDVNN
jgi:hypothetical protein